MRRTILAAAVGAVLLAGCSTIASRDTGETADAEAAQVSATAFGEVAGGLLGAEIGQALDDADRLTAAQAEYRALEYGRAGQPVGWRSGTTTNYGEVVVGAGYEVNRLDCREYSHTVYIGGRAQVSRGTACREPNGNWRSVS